MRENEVEDEKVFVCKHSFFYVEVFPSVAGSDFRERRQTRTT